MGANPLEALKGVEILIIFFRGEALRLERVAATEVVSLEKLRLCMIAFASRGCLWETKTLAPLWETQSRKIWTLSGSIVHSIDDRRKNLVPLTGNRLIELHGQV